MATWLWWAPKDFCGIIPLMWDHVIPLILRRARPSLKRPKLLSQNLWKKNTFGKPIGVLNLGPILILSPTLNFFTNSKSNYHKSISHLLSNSYRPVLTLSHFLTHLVLPLSPIPSKPFKHISPKPIPSHFYQSLLSSPSSSSSNPALYLVALTIIILADSPSNEGSALSDGQSCAIEFLAPLVNLQDPSCIKEKERWRWPGPSLLCPLLWRCLWSIPNPKLRPRLKCARGR